MFRINLYQLCASVLAAVPFILDGLQYGWSAPIVPPLKHTESPITLSGDTAWLVVTYVLPAAVGVFTIPFLVDRIGPQKSILLASSTSLIAWTFIAAATRIEYLYIGRFLAYLASELLFVIVPIYITEISSKEIRGCLLQQMHNMFFSGLITIYSLSRFVPFHVPAGVAAGLLLMQIGTFLLMPESPYYLISKNKQKDARMVLKKLQAPGENYKRELERLTTTINQETEEYGSWQDLITQKKNRKALIISGTLLIAKHFCGVIWILVNFHLILTEAESDYMETDVQSVTYYLLVTLVTSVVFSFLVDRFERKTMLLISYISSGVSLLIIAMYFHFKQFKNMEKLHLLPVCCIFAYGVLNNFGMGTLPRILAPELFSFKMRTLGLVFYDVINIVVQSLAVDLFSFVNERFGMFMPFYIFSGMCVLAAIFTWLLVPETKGKSLEDIQKDMSQL